MEQLPGLASQRLMAQGYGYGGEGDWKVAALTAVIAAYLFSTKRTKYAIPINVCRSIVLNFACINFLPLIFGYGFVWYTVAVAEGLCLIIAFVLKRLSERCGIVYR